MLIVNDSQTGSASFDVAELLESFSTAKPDLISKIARGDAAPKYCFKFAGKDDLNGLLDEAGKNISTDVVPSILLRYASERFTDLGSFEESGPSISSCGVEWRNAVRHGEIVWDLDNGQVLQEGSSDAKDLVDWRVVVTFGKDGSVKNSPSECPTIEWQLGSISADDIDAIRRLHLLQNNQDVREKFGDGLAAANHIQALAVENIWKRVFLSDAVLVFGDERSGFVEEAQSAHSLSHLLTVMLAPIFESEYPSHPDFLSMLSIKETAKLTGQFFGASAPTSSDVQRLAESFALPLGLVELHDEGYVPASAAALNDLNIVRGTLDGLEFSGESVVTIGELSSRMLAAPYGLPREARHLVLAALVAQRQFEFVTFSGNRINHRSLDLQIIWDDIAGLARPYAENYTGSRLREWAVLLTGKSNIRSLDSTEDRRIVVDALSEWLSEWRGARVLENFETLSDETLNSSIWRIAANLKKTFGAMADYIDALIKNTMPLDECIQNIVDLFSDSDAEFEKKRNDLDALVDFTLGAETREEIITYLSLCEITADRHIEQLRQELLELTGARYFGPAAPSRADIERVWYEFKSRFSSLYVEKHDAARNSADMAAKLKEILGSDRWMAFESFSDLSWFDPILASSATAAIRSMRDLECNSNVPQLLETQPFCSCSFKLGHFERRQDQPNRLEIIIDQGLTYFQMLLIKNGNELAKAIDTVSNGNDAALAVSLKKWLSELANSDGFINPPAPETRLLRSAIENINAAAPVSKKSVDSGLSGLLPKEVQDWENELDRLEIFAETKA